MKNWREWLIGHNETLLTHHREAMHRHFTRWRDSGYQDLTAHNRYIAHFEAGNRILTKNRRLRKEVRRCASHT